jgi:hypothetical protein
MEEAGMTPPMEPNDLKLLKRLHSRTPDPEVVSAFFRKGKDGYALLLEQLRSGTLTKWQMCNIMELLVRTRLHGDQDELFSILLEITKDDRVEVRTVATQLVKALTVIAEHRKDNAIKNANRTHVAPFLRGALARGLVNRGVEASVRDFLGGIVANAADI